MTLGRSERLMAEAGIVTVFGCALAFLDIFSAGGAGLGMRMAISIGGLLLGWIIMRILAIVGASIAKLLGIKVLWGYAFAIPIGSVLMAWAVLGVTGGNHAVVGKSFAQIWPSTIAIGVLFFALFYARYRRADQRSAALASSHLAERNMAGDPVSQLAATQLHEHLPSGFPSIIALSVEDHYLRVIAQERDEMVLMSLTQALKLMPQSHGFQVHRSWWVAKHVIDDCERTGRDLKLVLSNGMKVPVSRSKVQFLKGAGAL